METYRRARVGRWSGTVIAGLVLCALAAHPAAAGQRRADPAQEALRRAQYLLRDLDAKLEAAQAENHKLRDRLAASEGKLSKAERALTRGTNRNRKLKHYNTGLAARLHQYETQLREQIAAQRRTQTALREASSQREGLRGIVGRQARRIDYCEDANRKLYRAGVELIRRYRDKGVWAALLQREPVTGLGKVGLENILQGYRERIEKAHLGAHTTAAR